MKLIGKLLLIGAMLTFAGTASAAKANNKREMEVDGNVVTNHKTTILGKKISYSATTGTQPVWNSKGEPTATLFYTYYQRTDVKDKSRRPLIMSFNGGPGSASVWMHIAYTGPRILNVDDEGYPLQPYGVKSNPYSVLDVADIVFVNPVNTGYSRVLKDAKGKMPSRAEQGRMFFGVNADVRYLAEWLNTFVTRHNRWQSPKYLIGESYGATRVSGLAGALQSSQWMYLNGVVLVSPTRIGIRRDGPVSAANRLPYFAATAWHHRKLPAEYQNQQLEAFLPEVEAYTLNTYLPALAKGAMLSEQEKRQIAQQVSRYSGVSEKVILQNNLDVASSFFWKELLRDEGKSLGRLDSRYLGIDRSDSGTRPDYSSELSSWLHSFAPAIVQYIRNELNYKTDVKYNMFGSVSPWDSDGDRTGRNLRKAMAENPFLNVLIQSGYYDGATNYFDAKYTMWHLDPSGKMKDRIGFKGYRSGHMMYLRREDLQKSNQDLRDFIKATIPAKDQPAIYPR